MQRLQKRTELRLQVTCTAYFMKFQRVVFEIYERTDGRVTDSSSQYSTVLMEGVIMKQSELQGKYSLESTYPRESEIRAHLRP